MQNVGGMRPKIFFLVDWYMHSINHFGVGRQKAVMVSSLGPPCKSVWEPLEPTLSQWKEFEIGLKKIGFNKWQPYENASADGFYIDTEKSKIIIVA